MLVTELPGSDDAGCSFDELDPALFVESLTVVVVGLEALSLLYLFKAIAPPTRAPVAKRETRTKPMVFPMLFLGFIVLFE